MANLTFDQALELAGQHLGTSRLAEAEGLLRQVLAQQPNHSQALRGLAQVAQRVGRHDAAIDLYNRCIAQRPDWALPRAELGEVFQACGRLEEAISAYRDALALMPTWGSVYVNLGCALSGLNRTQEALDVCQRAAALAPAIPEAHNNLGNALQGCGRLEEALAAYRQATALRPEFAEAHNNLGAALLELGRSGEALEPLQKAIAHRPGYAQAHNNLSRLWAMLRRADRAIAEARRAVELDPQLADAHNNLGSAYADVRDFDQAIAALQRATALDPHSIHAFNNLGNAMLMSGRPDEAHAAFSRAISISPRSALAWNNLGNALLVGGWIDEAQAAFAKSMMLGPSDVLAHGNLTYAMLFDPAHDARAIARELGNWARQHALPLAAKVAAHANDRDPDKPLRIGYVSPDFRDHIVGRNLLPLFRHHDRRQFEITCYGDLPCPDHMTAHFEQRADRWRNILALSDEQAARQIRADGIDILVDTSLHLNGNRLLLFARKPAPVQVTFAGYPGSTGLAAIDYRLSDPYLDPPGSDESVYSEQTIRLPDSFWCYDPMECADLGVNELPALETGHITFGCLNNFAKVSPVTLDLWAKVLLNVPGSRLLLLAHRGRHRQRAADHLARLGIDPGRLEFVETQTRRAYLREYHRIDLGLDTLAYNGHSTSLDSYWMGVPVVTLVGPTVVGRAGFSQLSNLKLTELVAHAPLQFVELAVGLANDVPRLQSFRRVLRLRMEQSPLMDAACFARGIESSYRQMWRRWCAGQTITPVPKTCLG